MVDSAVDTVDTAALQLAGVTRSAALERWGRGPGKEGQGMKQAPAFNGSKPLEQHDGGFLFFSLKGTLTTYIFITT